MEVEIIPADGEWQQDDVLDYWRNAAMEYANVDLIFQSLPWFKHLIASNTSDGLFVAIVRDTGANIIGVVPFTICTQSIILDIYARTLGKFNFKIAFILGSEPALSRDNALYDEFLAALNRQFPNIDGVYFESVKQTSFLWKYLENHSALEDSYIKYLPSNTRSYEMVTFPNTFEEYFQSRKPKQRTDYRRRLRVLEKDFKEVKLVSCSSVADIERYYESILDIVKDTWQYKIVGNRIQELSKYTDLAERGLLSCFILICDNIPMAFDLGFTYKGIHQGDETGYRQSYRKYSPGLIMQLLRLEALCDQGVKTTSFGSGDAYYKSKLSNETLTDAAIMLLKKGLINRLKIQIHRLFHRFIKMIKTIKTARNHLSVKKNRLA